MAFSLFLLTLFFFFRLVMFFLYSYFIYLFIYFWLCWVPGSREGLLQLRQAGALLIAVRGPLTIAAPPIAGHRLQTRRPSSRGKRGPLFIAVRGPLFIAVRGPFTIAAPPIAGHRLQTRRLSSCGSRAQPLRGTRDPPRPGLEPASPALAGRLPTTAPPGKPY